MVLYAVPTTLYDPITSLFPQRKTANPTQDYLAANAVQITHGGYLVRDTATNEWGDVKQKQSVINMLTAEHAGVQSHGGLQIVLSRAEIKDFVNNDIPVLGGWVHIPGGPAVVTFDGKRCLNCFNDAHVVPPSDAHLFTNDAVDEKLHLFMRMFRESLCNQTGIKTVEEMIEIANNKIELEFSFAMQWLAAIVQNPGINLETNLWFIGEMKGIGKGTLTRVLRLILGRLVGRAPAGEFERGWTNRIEGRLIYEVDEFENSNKFDWGKFIKRDTTNQIVEVVKRFVGGYNIVNITNWIFHSNNENPLPLERDDRRNFQIMTTNKPEWKLLALRLNRWLTDNPNEARAMAAAFHAVLHHIEVDMEFIALAPATEIRDDNQDHNFNAVERWIVEDERYPRDTWIDGRDLFAQFFEQYKEKYFKRSGISSAQSWGLHMAKLVRRKRIERRKARANRNEYLIPALSYPAGDKPAPATNVLHLVNRLHP